LLGIATQQRRPLIEKYFEKPQTMIKPQIILPLIHEKIKPFIPVHKKEENFDPVPLIELIPTIVETLPKIYEAIVSEENRHQVTKDIVTHIHKFTKPARVLFDKIGKALDSEKNQFEIGQDVQQIAELLKQAHDDFEKIKSTFKEFCKYIPTFIKEHHITATENAEIDTIKIGLELLKILSLLKPEEKNILPITGLAPLIPFIVHQLTKEESNVIPLGTVAQIATAALPYLYKIVSQHEENAQATFSSLIETLGNLFMRYLPMVIELFSGKKDANGFGDIFKVIKPFIPDIIPTLPFEEENIGPIAVAALTALAEIAIQHLPDAIQFVQSHLGEENAVDFVKFGIPLLFDILLTQPQKLITSEANFDFTKILETAFQYIQQIVLFFKGLKQEANGLDPEITKALIKAGIECIPIAVEFAKDHFFKANGVDPEITKAIVEAVIHSLPTIIEVVKDHCFKANSIPPEILKTIVEVTIQLLPTAIESISSLFKEEESNLGPIAVAAICAGIQCLPTILDMAVDYFKKDEANFAPVLIPAIAGIGSIIAGLSKLHEENGDLGTTAIVELIKIAPEIIKIFVKEEENKLPSIIPPFVFKPEDILRKVKPFARG